MKKIFLLTLISIYAFNLHAQKLDGRVLNTLGQSLPNAHIQSVQTSKHTHSNENGYFTLDDIKEGDTIVISQIGFETVKYEATKARKLISIKLKRRSIQLSNVYINKKMDALNLFSDINVKTAPVQNAQEVLLKVPGLMIGQHAGGGKAEQIFLRGFDIDHGTDVGISVENMPVNMVSHAHGQGYADMHFLIPETIQKVDFDKGPYDAEKGNFSTAGYVDIKLKERLDHNLIKVEGGQFNTQRLVGMLNVLNTNKEQAYIATEFNKINGPFESSQNFRRSNFMARYHNQLDDANTFTISASHFSSQWDASGQIPERAVRNGLITRFGAIDDTEGGQTSRSNVWLKHTKLLKNNGYLKSSLFYSNYAFDLFSNFTFFLEDSVNGDQIRQRESRNLLGGQFEYGKQFSLLKKSAFIKTGLTYRNDRSVDNELNHTKNRKTTLEQYQYGDIDETNLSAYSNVEIELGNFLIQPGLRADYFSFGYTDKLNPTYNPLTRDDVVFSPKLNVLYNYNPNLQLYLKTGKGFHSNDSRVVLNRDVRKNLPGAYGADLGFIWKAHKNLFINLATWQLYLEQEFVYVGDAGIVEPSGKTMRKGVDLSVRYQPTPWLFINCDANYAHAKALETDENESFIPLAPQLTLLGNVQILHPNGWFGGLRVRHIGDRAANEDNSIVAAGYTVTDGNIGYDFGKIECGLNVRNIFNVAWNETQFATESRLQNESQPVEEIHFTPGTPFAANAFVSFKF